MTIGLIFDWADQEKKVYSRLRRRISSVVSRPLAVTVIGTSSAGALRVVGVGFRLDHTREALPLSHPGARCWLAGADESGSSSCTKAGLSAAPDEPTSSRLTIRARLVHEHEPGSSLR